MSMARWEPNTQRVVGVGASAGNLDALEQLVAALPSAGRHAYVVVAGRAQPQDLAERLARVSGLRVLAAAHGHRLEPDTIVVAPAHAVVRRRRDAIVLLRNDELKAARRDRPIDSLFESLARTLGDRASGVVLAGTGDDGTGGLRAILGAGGTTIVDSSATSQFATYVLPPREIGPALAHPGDVEQASGAADDTPALFHDAAVLERAVRLTIETLATTLPAGEPLRVWVPGCSTGEDAYTVAMLLAEHLGTEREFLLFGTDVAEHAIEAARLGRYSETAVRYVNAARRARFFETDGTGYRIKRELRARCVFVPHDTASDPPISRLHLIVCRELVAKLAPTGRRDLIPIFHYALEQPGYLVLGRKDLLHDFDHLFTPCDAGGQIFQREPAARSRLSIARMPGRTNAAAARRTAAFQSEVDQLLLERKSSAAVVVDESLEVVQFRGRTGPYLELPAGHPRLGVLEMAREQLRRPLARALESVRLDDAPVRREDIVLRDDDAQRLVSLEIIPLRGEHGKRHFLILFEDAAARRPRGTKALPKPDHEDFARLRDELDRTKTYLRSVLAESAATNEALAFATAELQLADEKLVTVSSELQRGNELLRHANEDLINALASLDIAIFIVDEHAHLRLFTPKARDLMGLVPSDIGRPIGELGIDAPDVARRVAHVLRSGVADDSQFERLDQTHYRMHIRPYRVRGVRIGGAVISLIDVTDLTADIRASQAARNQATAIVEAVPAPLAVVDHNLQLVSFNAAFSELFGVVTGELLAIGQWHAPDTRERLLAALRTGDGFDDHETEHTSSDATRILRIAARRLPGASQLLIGIADITPLREAEQAREANRRERDGFLGAVSHELRTPLSTILLWAEALRGFARTDQQGLDAVAAIVDAAHAESQLVDDLLDLALSRTDGLSVAPVPLDAATLVRDMLARLEPAAAEKQLVVQTDLASGTQLIADPRRLRQIVSQLVGNAIKFTPQGGTIGVSLEHRDDGILLRVHDTGPGLPADAIAHAFEPFWQADASTTRTHGGLGIGLSLVKHLVDRHGGSIAIASGSDGQGTTVTVRFPLPGA